MSIPFRKLGLGGGGIKGVLHIGGLQELSRHQPLVFPDGVYGVSIGSIVATYISFELPLDDRITSLVGKYLLMEKIIPRLSFKDLSNAYSSKGLYSMNTFEDSVVNMFLEAGLDIRGKTLGDAKMPLYIIASNITTGRPTIFSKRVPLLDAIKCSCCIPAIFRPQELYGELYVDGDLFVPNLSTIVKDGLVFSLLKRASVCITPKTIETMQPLQYMRDLYIMSTNRILNYQKTDLTVYFYHKGLSSDSDLDDFDISSIFESGKKQLNNFLRSKGFDEEGTESLR
jgi:NTE family protein